MTLMGTWPRGTRGCGDTSRATGGGGDGHRVAAPRCPRGRGARVPVVLAPTQRPPPAGAIRGRRGLALPAPPWHRHPCWHSSSPCSVPPQVGNPATPAWVPPQNWVPLMPKLGAPWRVGCAPRSGCLSPTAGCPHQTACPPPPQAGYPSRAGCPPKAGFVSLELGAPYRAGPSPSLQLGAS